MTRHASRRIFTLVAAVPVMFTGTACYEYHSASASAVHPGETVHVVLSPEASSSLASSIGPNATALDGRVVAADAGALRLALTQIARSVGPEEFLKDQLIDVPAGGAPSVTVRSFDRMRTVLALGGLLAGAIAAAVVTNEAGIISVRGAPTSSTR